jgi:ketosteroid isomerase-like protein
VGQQNEKIVVLAHAAFSEGDLDALAELIAPDAVFDFSRSIGPLKGIYRGRDEIARFADAFAEAFETFKLSPVDFVVGPDGEIVVRQHVSARGRASGLEIDTVPDIALVWEFCDGKVTKTTMYQPHADALEAVGLRLE